MKESDTWRRYFEFVPLVLITVGNDYKNKYQGEGDK